MDEEFKIYKEKKRILRYYKRLLLSSRKLNSIKICWVLMVPVSHLSIELRKSYIEILPEGTT